MRLDQDINFNLGGVPMVMRLDTTAPENVWIITPKCQEDMGDSFANAIKKCIGFPHQLFSFGFDEADVYVALVADDQAVVIYGGDEPGASMACNIFASLPDWSGESLKGLRGAGEFVDFLSLLKEHAGIEVFRRSDGEVIDYTSALLLLR
ncbi:MAG: hypothetical protein HY454_01735 [Parcubacteria group bacterium]|nr:hypothetical protein [Parcubacteria group bacterium]